MVCVLDVLGTSLHTIHQLCLGFRRIDIVMPLVSSGHHDASVMGCWGLADLGHMRSTKAYTGISNV